MTQSQKTWGFIEWLSEQDTDVFLYQLENNETAKIISNINPLIRNKMISNIHSWFSNEDTIAEFIKLNEIITRKGMEWRK